MSHHDPMDFTVCCGTGTHVEFVCEGWGVLNSTQTREDNGEVQTSFQFTQVQLTQLMQFHVSSFKVTQLKFQVQSSSVKFLVCCLLSVKLYSPFRSFYRSSVSFLLCCSLVSMERSQEEHRLLQRQMGLAREQYEAWLQQQAANARPLQQQLQPPPRPRSRSPRRGRSGG